MKETFGCKVCSYGFQWEQERQEAHKKQYSSENIFCKLNLLLSISDSFSAGSITSSHWVFYTASTKTLLCFVKEWCWFQYPAPDYGARTLEDMFTQGCTDIVLLCHPRGSRSACNKLQIAFSWHCFILSTSVSSSGTFVLSAFNGPQPKPINTECNH